MVGGADHTHSLPYRGLVFRHWRVSTDISSTTSFILLSCRIPITGKTGETNPFDMFDTLIPISAHQLNAVMERLHHVPIEYMLAEVSVIIVIFLTLILFFIFSLQLIFGLIFTLPTPPHSLLYYGSLTIELCKLRPATYPVIVSSLIIR